MQNTEFQTSPVRANTMLIIQGYRQQLFLLNAAEPH